MACGHLLSCHARSALHRHPSRRVATTKQSAWAASCALTGGEAPVSVAASSVLGAEVALNKVKCPVLVPQPLRRSAKPTEERLDA